MNYDRNWISTNRSRYKKKKRIKKIFLFFVSILLSQKKKRKDSFVFDSYFFNYAVGAYSESES